MRKCCHGKKAAGQRKLGVACFLCTNIEKTTGKFYIRCTQLMKLLSIYFAIVLFLSSCGKNNKACWQAFDPQGADAQGLVLCDQTKAEAEAAWPQYWFYKAGEQKFCWRVQIGSNVYNTWGVPASMAQRYMQENGAYQFTKIDCNSFCVVEWYEKHKNKITNQFGPVRSITDKNLSADSCGKLSVGRIVVVRETSDSLITRELVKKFP